MRILIFKRLIPHHPHPKVKRRAGQLERKIKLNDTLMALVRKELRPYKERGHISVVDQRFIVARVIVCI
jgi:hypothetical protein